MFADMLNLSAFGGIFPFSRHIPVFPHRIREILILQNHLK